MVTADCHGCRLCDYLPRNRSYHNSFKQFWERRSQELFVHDTDPEQTPNRQSHSKFLMSMKLVIVDCEDKVNAALPIVNGVGSEQNQGKLT
jgi:hypothetical protein